MNSVPEPGYYGIRVLHLASRNMLNKFHLAEQDYTLMVDPPISKVTGVILVPFGAGWFQLVGGISFVRAAVIRAMHTSEDEILIVKIIKNEKLQEAKS